MLLAYRSEAEIHRYLSRPLEQSTEHTVADPLRLREELAAIRREGCAWGLEELEIGLVGVSPVFTGGQKVVAWVNVCGPSNRFRVEKRPEFAALAMQAAREITDRLGGSGRSEPKCRRPRQTDKRRSRYHQRIHFIHGGISWLPNTTPSSLAAATTG